MPEASTPIDWSAAKSINAGTSSEPLVAVSNDKEWITYPAYFNQKIEGALPDIWVRAEVRERLQQAALGLPSGYRLVLLDGWRSKKVQRYLFADMRARVVAKNPSLSDSEIDKITLNFASLPSDDPITPSPHITGGSVDVTLADNEGRFLDMGSEFDEVSENSWTRAQVSKNQAELRHILLSAMLGAGFTNLPSEWWHYDFGNWVWAWYRGEASAIYGPTSL